MAATRSGARALTFALATEADADEIAAVRIAAGEHLTRTYGHGHWSGGLTVRGVRSGMRTRRCWSRSADERSSARSGWRPRSRGRSTRATSLRQSVRSTWSDMAVDPTAQRQGVGRALLERATQIAREWPGDAIWLDAYDAPAGGRRLLRSLRLQGGREGDLTAACRSSTTSCGPGP